MMFVCRPYITLFLSTKKFVAGKINNIVVPAPITTIPHKIFIMSDEEGKHCHHAAARRRRSDDTLPPPHCHERQRCAAATIAYVLFVLVVVVSIAIAAAAFS